MAVQSTQAIVLKRRDLRESSIIVTLFTKDFGKLTGLVKGIRSPKSRYLSRLDIFGLNRIVFYESQKKDIQLVTVCELENSFENLHKDLKLTAYASFFVELVDSVTEPFDKNQKIFNLLANSLSLLSKKVFPEKAFLIFQIKLLELSGLSPLVSFCAYCNKRSFNYRFSFKAGGVICKNCFQKDPEAQIISRGALATIFHIANTGWLDAKRLNPSKKTSFEIIAILNKFIEYHLQKKFKSLQFLNKITD